MSKFRFQRSKKLQTLANKKDHDALEEASDLKRTLDVNDCDDSTGDHIHGVLEGIRLVYEHGKKEIFMINFPDYVDDDGVALFVGSEKQVFERISALPDREGLKEEEEGKKERKKNPPPPPPPPEPEIPVHHLQGTVQMGESAFRNKGLTLAEARELVPEWGLPHFDRVVYRDFRLTHIERNFHNDALKRVKCSFLHKNQGASEESITRGWYSSLELRFDIEPLYNGDKPYSVHCLGKSVYTKPLETALFNINFLVELDNMLDKRLCDLYPPKKG